MHLPSRSRALLGWEDRVLRALIELGRVHIRVADDYAAHAVLEQATALDRGVRTPPSVPVDLALLAVDLGADPSEAEALLATSRERLIEEEISRLRCQLWPA